MNNSIINITLLRNKGFKRITTSSRGNDTEFRKKTGKLEKLLSSLPIDSRTSHTTGRYINESANTQTNHTTNKININKYIQKDMAEQDKTIEDLEVDLKTLQLKIDTLELKETELALLDLAEKDPVKLAVLKTKVDKTAKELKTAILYRGSILSVLVRKKKEEDTISSPQDKRHKAGENFPRAGGQSATAEDKDPNYIDLINSPARKRNTTTENTHMKDVDSRKGIGNPGGRGVGSSGRGGRGAGRGSGGGKGGTHDITDKSSQHSQFKPSSLNRVIEEQVGTAKQGEDIAKQTKDIENTNTPPTILRKVKAVPKKPVPIDEEPGQESTTKEGKYEDGDIKETNSIDLTNNTETEQTASEVSAPRISFMEALLKVTLESEDTGDVRVRVTFKARNEGKSPRTTVQELKRIVGMVFKWMPDTKLMYWVDEPKNVAFSAKDLLNPVVADQDWIKCLDRPSKGMRGSAWRTGESNRIGLRFKTKLSLDVFINRWNMKKRVVQEAKAEFTPMYMAELQKSPNAYLVGVAAGSTEDQDLTGVSDYLAKITGIAGIGISYQNIQQPDITSEFWNKAKVKMEQTRSELEQAGVTLQERGRKALRMKYKCAPSGACIYVPDRASVRVARSILLKTLGQSNSEGGWPEFGNGSIMRFFPVKGTNIRKQANRELARQRLGVHVYMKSMSDSIMTTFQDIHDKHLAFKGASFAEIVLRQKNEKGQRVFLHFEKCWSIHEDNKTWRIGVVPGQRENAIKICKSTKDRMLKEYGNDIGRFFTDFYDIGQSKRKEPAYDDDEDWDWNDSDDNKEIQDLLKQGVELVGLAEFLSIKNDDEEDEDTGTKFSWGTGKTGKTDMSTITKSEQNTRVKDVLSALTGAGLKKDEREAVVSGETPWAYLMQWVNTEEEQLWSVELFIEKYQKIKMKNMNEDKGIHEDNTQAPTEQSQPPNEVTQTSPKTQGSKDMDTEHPDAQPSNEITQQNHQANEHEEMDTDHQKAPEGVPFN